MADTAQLAQIFQSTLLPAVDARRAAEASLKAGASQNGYAISVLKVVGEASLPPEVRLAASINFKNHCKYHWSPSTDNSDDKPIEDAEKAEIRKYIITLMLECPVNIRAQLSEALTGISGHDFPHQWPTLLPELQSRLATSDIAVLEGVLATANSVFKRFRNTALTTEVSGELDYSQKQMSKPCLAVLTSLVAHLKAAPQATDAATVASVSQLLSAARFASRVFFSLNKLGLSEDLAAQLSEWMSLFHELLTYTHPGVIASDPDRESLLDALKAAVCENIILVERVEEEDFEPFLNTFAADVWGLLTSLSLNAGQDHLATQAMRFLTTVAQSVHWKLFQNQGTLQQICESVIVPSIRMRDDDEERFTMDHIEYIRRDTEGNDTDTRRRTASDLVQALRSKMEPEVTALFTGYVAEMLKQYAASPLTEWRSKDCALTLVSTLLVKGETAQQGVTTINSFVDISDFFTSQILPELSAPPSEDVGPCVLKADALRFVSRFRAHIPKPAALALVPHLVALLGCESNVVHSYAAITLDRMLAQREGGAPRYQPEDVTPLPLLTALFGAFRHPDSAENEHLMRAVLRLINFTGAGIASVAVQCMQTLCEMLTAVSRNPQHPGFNHALFEAIGAVLSHTSAASPDQLPALEGLMMPPFQHILAEDVQEFHPYVFQLFTQIVASHPGALPASYLSQLFPSLLTGFLWERPGNVPALTPLLAAFLSRAGPEITQGGHVSSILGVFQKLLASNAHCGAAFNILQALKSGLPQAAMAQYDTQVWGLILQRLQTARTPKYVRVTINHLAWCIVHCGAEVLERELAAVQPGVFWMLLQQVWIPSLSSVVGSDEFKTCAVALTRLLTQLPPAAWQAQGVLWGSVLTALMGYLRNQAEQEDSTTVDAPSLQEMGFTASFSRLVSCNPRRASDPLPEFLDCSQYLATALGQLMVAHPGFVPAMVEAALGAENKAELQTLLQQHAVTVA